MGKNFGGTDSDYGYQIYKTEGDGYLLMGGSNSRDGDVNQVNCPYTHCFSNTWVLELDANKDIIWNRTYGPQGWDSYHEMNAVKRIGERDFMIAGIIHEAENHTGDVNCEPYPVDSGKSAWIYRLYDPLDGINTLAYPSLKVYPNPANKQLFIDLPKHNTFIKIDILNIFGESIKQIEALPQQTQILWNCNTVAAGIYFYQTVISGVFYRGKVVVQK